MPGSPASRDAPSPAGQDRRAKLNTTNRAPRPSLASNNAGIKLRGASFLMHQVYDDETTFKLVAAASNVSGLPTEVCLEEFGKHFLVYCQKNGYDQILRVLGGNLYDFLTNLDNLHDHLASIYPGMRAPSFRVTRNLDTNAASPDGPGGLTPADQDQQRLERQGCRRAGALSSGSMYLHYYSERNGLSPIVKGLVMAVAKEFFLTDVVITECKLVTPQLNHTDDHVVLKIDRKSQADLALDKQSGRTMGDETAALCDHAREAQQDRARSEERQHHQQLTATRSQHKTMLSSIYGDSLSKNAADSLVNSEIMMQTFPFHVIFDRHFNLVQVGKSLLRVTRFYWQQRANDNDGRSLVKFCDLFSIVRPKIEFTFDAISDHTNQVFVVKTRPLVLNADRLSSLGGRGARQTGAPRAHRSSVAAGAPPVRPAAQAAPAPICPMSRAAAARRSTLAGDAALPAATERHQVLDDSAEPIGSYLSLRLKGQMIILSGGERADDRAKWAEPANGDQDGPLCLYLCSPRVDHLNQLMECGVKMSDLALHDRARELMLMSHTHKEDREAVKKLDQATNDLKKMDTKLRQENKRTNEVLHNIFPAKIATLLSHGHKVESESFDLVTCLYSDIIGFTKMCGSENVRPIDIVRLLNTLYLQFDNLTNIHGVFKVETIGDAYVIVGGLPEPVEDHADRCVRMGLDMVKVIATVRSPADGQPIQVSFSVARGLSEWWWARRAHPDDSECEHTGPKPLGACGPHLRTLLAWLRVRTPSRSHFVSCQAFY